jgi:hypothetical protein
MTVDYENFDDGDQFEPKHTDREVSWSEPRHCCWKHWQEDTDNSLEQQMIVCPTCGGKRCQKAADCSLECTGDPPRCTACGVPWSEHLGAMVTCQQLQDALARERNYREQIESLLNQRNWAQAKVDAFAKCRDEAVKDGVYWKEKYDELLKRRWKR